MSLKAMLQARKAVVAHNKGDIETARKLYEEALTAGVQDPGIMLSYSVLLIRGGEYEKAKDLLAKASKGKGMKPDVKQNIYVNYAVCCYKLGNLDKALEYLAYQHTHLPTSLVYQTYGYLLIEKGDFDKALEYNLLALDYDDEDPIVLDNLGQTYYRLGNDKETAKGYFEKALKLRESQIDTLYFLSRYDIDNGDKAAAIEKLEKALDGRFSPLNYRNKEQLTQDLTDLKK